MQSQSRASPADAWKKIGLGGWVLCGEPECDEAHRSCQYSRSCWDGKAKQREPGVSRSIKTVPASVRAPIITYFRIEYSPSMAIRSFCSPRAGFYRRIRQTRSRCQRARVPPFFKVPSPSSFDTGINIAISTKTRLTNKDKKCLRSESSSRMWIDSVCWTAAVVTAREPYPGTSSGLISVTGGESVPLPLELATLANSLGRWKGRGIRCERRHARRVRIEYQRRCGVEDRRRVTFVETVQPQREALNGDCPAVLRKLCHGSSVVSNSYYWPSV